MTDINSLGDDTSLGRQVLIGGQMLFVAFGALVLVPILTGLDLNVAFFTAGVGTLIFQLVTRRSVPVFLASSFAFIAPITFSVGQWGLPATMGGLIAAGFFYVVLSLIVRVRGSGFLYRLFPPVVIGPVIMVIGLGLAPTAISMANGTANPAVNETTFIILAGVSLLTTLLVSTVAGGILRLIPILCGVAAGYCTAVFMGVVDFTPMHEAAWVGLPNFSFPEYNLNAILL